MTETGDQRRYEHIVVLMGGWSAEREVSLNSGNACADALETQGYRVTRLDADRDLTQRLKEIRPNACFNALHGRWGEDGCVQGILEVLSIPYTHSGVLASALAMNKEQTRRIARAAGIPIAEGRVVARAEAAQTHVFEPPYVAKPICEGSSVGVVIVPRGANRPPDAIRQVPAVNDEILVERYVAGRELTCGVIGGRVTDIIDIVPAANLKFYDYEAKYAPGGSRHILPADLSGDVYRAVQAHALGAHRALGCRGVSRSDFRYDAATGELAFLEINTQPGMTGTSLVPELAQYAGMSFAALVVWLVEDATCNR
ncbi:MAG: D-alanine--D-alanine ligase [Hyphomicrobiaceae bacterium]